VAKPHPVEEIFLQNRCPFLGETEEILLSGYGDNDQPS
jgi:hypothetical protein